MSELLEALYRGDRNRVDEVLAGDPELDVFEAAALGRSDRLGRLLEQDASNMKVPAPVMRRRRRNPRLWRGA